MTGQTTAPYGTWKSSITSESITKGTTNISDVIVDPINSVIYHIEERPSEAGRSVLVQTDLKKDVVDAETNVRDGVYEYGGAAAVAHGNNVYFSNGADARVYRKTAQGHLSAITPANKVHRFANFDVHPTNPRFLVAVLEDHTVDTPATVINSLCLIDSETQLVTTIVSGADFYASPKFSPDGTHLSWKQWFHPDMPWEGAEIFVADVVISDDTIRLQNHVLVAGERLNVSVTYPSWISANTLLFNSDKSGFQNPWKYAVGSEASPVFPEPVAEDFGSPEKRLGWSPYAVLDNKGKFVLFTSFKDGRSTLYVVNIEDGTKTELDCPYVSIRSMRSVSTALHQAAFLGDKVDDATTVVKCTVSLSSTPPTCSFTALTPSLVHTLDPGYTSLPQPMTIKVSPEGHSVPVIYWPPQNPLYSGTSIEGERPPCVVNVHGGPTFLTLQSLNLEKLFFTSRGYAWLDVNYTGSYGYGRAFMNRMQGQWGIADVEDTIQATRAISQVPYNLVDPKRLAVRGISAGGFTTLASISNSSDVSFFSAGTCLCGVCDLALLMADTHKFESQYGFKLLGGTPQEIPEVYASRSPINHTDQIVTPLLILHGDNDKVVPALQAETIYKAVKEQGGKVEYVLYPGEGHGFRQAKHLSDALEREIGFYESVFKLN